MTTYRAGTNDTPFLFNGRYGVMTDPNGLLVRGVGDYIIENSHQPGSSGFSDNIGPYLDEEGARSKCQMLRSDSAVLPA